MQFFFALSCVGKSIQKSNPRITLPMLRAAPIATVNPRKLEHGFRRILARIAYTLP